MEDVRGLKELQLDALREVANIGAGHAATALSQMTNRTIMIAVPEVNVRPLEEVTDLVGRPDEVVAAVLMHMMGDLTGRTLVMFDETSARALCDILFRRSAGTTGEFGAMEQSGLKEAGNILASAYMNALSDFMGMMLVPSVPSLVVALSAPGQSACRRPRYSCSFAGLVPSDCGDPPTSFNEARRLYT